MICVSSRRHSIEWILHRYNLINYHLSSFKRVEYNLALVHDLSESRQRCLRSIIASTSSFIFSLDQRCLNSLLISLTENFLVGAGFFSPNESEKDNNSPNIFPPLLEFIFYLSILLYDSLLGD